MQIPSGRANVVPVRSWRVPCYFKNFLFTIQCLGIIVFKLEVMA